MPMYDPPHPGEILLDNVKASGWTVTECANRLGVARDTLSRLLNGHGSISPSMALALERIGWSEAILWVRLQASYNLAQERRKQAVA